MVDLLALKSDIDKLNSWTTAEASSVVDLVALKPCIDESNCRITTTVSSMVDLLSLKSPTIFMNWTHIITLWFLGFSHCVFYLSFCFWNFSWKIQKQKLSKHITQKLAIRFDINFHSSNQSVKKLKFTHTQLFQPTLFQVPLFHSKRLFLILKEWNNTSLQKNIMIIIIIIYILNR